MGSCFRSGPPLGWSSRLKFWPAQPLNGANLAPRKSPRHVDVEPGFGWKLGAWPPPEVTPEEGVRLGVGRPSVARNLPRRVLRALYVGNAIFWFSTSCGHIRLGCQTMFLNCGKVRGA